jgi:phospholipid transport system transporter-binding protein
VSAPAGRLADGAPPGATLEFVASAPGRFAARGVLTFATARRARNAGLQALRSASAPELEIDLSAVSHADSAGLAVLLDWLAVSKRDGRRLRYAGLPAGLLAIAHISGVTELLRQGV